MQRCYAAARVETNFVSGLRIGVGQGGIVQDEQLFFVFGRGGRGSGQGGSLRFLRLSRLEAATRNEETYCDDCQGDLWDEAIPTHVPTLKLCSQTPEERDGWRILPIPLSIMFGGAAVSEVSRVLPQNR